MTMDVSCVINAHNEGSYLHRAIESALRNVEYASLFNINCEIIVILDKPSESTIAICEKHAAYHPETIKPVYCDYGDLGESRNHGVLESRGEYIAFLDGDDLWGESWVSSAFLKSKSVNKPCVVHPQYNVYFSKSDCHVLEHTCQDDPEFFPEYFSEKNYWTSLSFSSKGIYLEHPYKSNDLTKYFGYEDWTWNYETMQHGIKHTIAGNTLHYIRRGKKEPSLLDRTNQNCLPRIYPLYNSKIAPSTSFRTSHAHGAAG